MVAEINNTTVAMLARRHAHTPATESIVTDTMVATTTNVEGASQQTKTDSDTTGSAVMTTDEIKCSRRDCA